MQLLVFITNQVYSINPILNALVECGIGGATTINCEGMLQALTDETDNPPPILGSLRRFVNPNHEPGKMLLIVLPEEQIACAKAVIHKQMGDLQCPNTGILFTLPISSVEGGTPAQ